MAGSGEARQAREAEIGSARRGRAGLGSADKEVQCLAWRGMEMQAIQEGDNDMSINTITLIGRLGRDPELKYTQSGKAVANFSLAVDRRQKGETDWFHITTWDKLAERCGEHLHKGRQAAVRGRMQSRTYETQDGQKRTAWEVVAEDVQFLGAREDSADAAQRPAPQRQVSPATRQVVQQAWAAHGPDALDDDQVPF